MKLHDINITVFQSLDPEIQAQLIQAQTTTFPEIIGFTLVALMFFWTISRTL